MSASVLAYTSERGLRRRDAPIIADEPPRRCRRRRAIYEMSVAAQECDASRSAASDTRAQRVDDESLIRRCLMRVVTMRRYAS